jgi:hypothetical protein
MSQAVKLSHSTDADGPQHLAEESASWVLTMKDAGLAERASFGAWVTRSAKHIDEFLLASAIDDGLRRIGSQRIAEVIRRSRNRLEEGLGATEDIDEDTMAGRLNAQYRRPLLQVFLTRRVAPSRAEDLIHYAFRAASDEIRKHSFKDEASLREYLYRLARSLAMSFWQGEAARSNVTDPGGVDDL